MSAAFLSPCLIFTADFRYSSWVKHEFKYSTYYTYIVVILLSMLLQITISYLLVDTITSGPKYTRRRDVTAIIRVIRCKCGECGKRSNRGSSSKGPTYVCNDHKYRSLVTLIDRSIDPCPDNNQSYGVWCHFNDPQCKYETRHNCRSVVVVVFRNCTSASSYHYNDRSRSHQQQQQ